MEQINLKAELRTVLGRKVQNLRNEGKIPAVVYGRGAENWNIAFDKKEFTKVLKEAGSATIVNLVVEGKDKIKTLIMEPQFNPVTGQIVHVDLYKVNMKEEIHTEIPLVFVGESLAVKDLEGNLMTLKDAVEVKCLPDKLVSEIEVDLGTIKTFDDMIKISDLVIPEGIEALADPEEIVAQVTPPRTEEEPEETPAADAEKAAIEGMEAAAVAEKAEGADEEAKGNE